MQTLITPEEGQEGQERFFHTFYCFSGLPPVTSGQVTLEGVRLTGYKRRHKQTAWLRKAGIPFIVSAKGFPVVALKELDRRLIKDPKIRAPKDTPKLWLVR